MDSPHLLRLGFLLLALAASHPSIAMSTVSPGKATKDSSSGKTVVTIYHCKDCDRSMCKSEPYDFSHFDIIAETKDETFSGGVIELETTETHIIACLQQGNSFSEGIYGIFWKKAEGVGLSCGILNSEENGRGNISTEEKKICCEAETNVWQRNPTLKCYTRKSGPKPTTPPADIPGNPEFLTSKKSSIGVLSALLIVVVCAGCAALYCYFFQLRHGQAFRQGRHCPDRENLTHLCQPSTKEKTSPPAASSSSLMMYRRTTD